jgi:hypothetical protein
MTGHPEAIPLWAKSDFRELNRQVRKAVGEITVAVGTIITDRPPHTDPYVRVYAYGSYHEAYLSLENLPLRKLSHILILRVG